VAYQFDTTILNIQLNRHTNDIQTKLNEEKLIAELDKLKEEIENSTINKSFVNYRVDEHDISIDVSLEINEQSKEVFSEFINIINKLIKKGYKIDEFGRTKTYNYKDDLIPEYYLHAIKKRSLL
jgi:hypothetical protein